MFPGFGPKIGVFALESQHFNDIKKHADSILDNPETQVDHGKQLAGQIHSEPAVMDDKAIYNIFKLYVKRYVDTFLKQQGLGEKLFNMNITSAWLVDQKPGEYNPPHDHGDSNISSVMYLQMPIIEQDKKLLEKKNRADGMINFINNSNRALHEFETGGVTWMPEVGMLYVFPSRLIHSVNPWKGKGKRISLSFNTQVNFV